VFVSSSVGFAATATNPLRLWISKPELGVELIERAAGWDVCRAPVLGDSAYGDNTELRERLDDAGSEYVLSVSQETTVFAPETTFAVPERAGKTGRPPSRPRSDPAPESIGALIAGLDADAFTTRGRADQLALLLPTRARRARMGASDAVSAARGMADRRMARGPRRADRLLDLHLPGGTEPERLARLARLRWRIELD
jgi:hypothetical protein